MPERIAVHRIKLGQNVTIPAGTRHNFTAAQIAELEPIGALRTVREEKVFRQVAARAQPDDPGVAARARRAEELNEEPSDEAEEGERTPNLDDDEPPAKPAARDKRTSRSAPPEKDEL